MSLAYEDCVEACERGLVAVALPGPDCLIVNFHKPSAKCSTWIFSNDLTARAGYAIGVAIAVRDRCKEKGIDLEDA